jgi:hypothetical protein
MHGMEQGDTTTTETAPPSNAGPWSTARKIAVGTVGGTVLVAGVVLMPFPGLPGTPVVLAGLAILGTEFEVARRSAERVRTQAKRAIDRLR